MGGSAYEEKGTGALPPEDKVWQIGKTAASIRFVGDAEKYLVEHDGETGLDGLKSAVEDVKNGTLVLQDWTTVEEFLNTLP